MLAACGEGNVGQGGSDICATTAPPAAAARRSYTGELTTTDGYRYRITVVVGLRSATGAPDECPGPPAAGRIFLPVTLTVANESSDRPAPFPPVRVEMSGAAEAKPAQVQVRDSGGACTFAPRVPALPPGASVTFKGTSPAIDESATRAARAASR